MLFIPTVTVTVMLGIPYSSPPPIRKCVAVSTVFKSFVSYYMFDRICLETHVKMNHSVFFTLSEQKKFKHLSYDAIDEIVNVAGYAGNSDVTQLHKDLYADII